MFALNISFYFVQKLNTEWAKKEQEKEAFQNVELLASEASFENQLSMLFKRYCEVVKSDVQIDFVKNAMLTAHLEQTAKVLFREPFPEHNLYVFKIPNGKKSAELLYAKDNGNSSKKPLCYAFDYLFNLSNTPDKNKVEEKKKESFARQLVGQYSNIEAIAKELRGLPAFANIRHHAYWFIWDYAVIPDKGVVGAILTSPEIEKYDEIGRLLALRNQQSRGKAIGAFVPVYKEYGDPVFQHPLEKSELFRKWVDDLVIQDEKDIEKWMREDLPQGVDLGNYTAFTYLEKGASHISVILVRAIKSFSWPKWLNAINILSFTSMAFIIFLGLFYNIWPPVNLRIRFVLSYLMASVLPLCLLGVTAYGYLLQYRKTAINNAVNELQTALKSFDSYKAATSNEYKSAFTRALNDEALSELISEKGVYDSAVAKRVVDIFENDKSFASLPILGVKFFDEAGSGAFAKGGAPANINVERFVDTFQSTYTNILRMKIISEDPEAEGWMKPFDTNDDNDLAGKAYTALTGNSIKEAMNKFASTPLPRKNGDFFSFQIYDFIKVNGKTRYALFVVWDDKTLDDRILQTALDNYSLKNQKQSFVGYRIKGQSIESVGNITRHASTNTMNRIEEIARFTENSKRISSTVTEDATLIVAMPAVNFAQTVLVGWINLLDVEEEIFTRQMCFFALLILSILVLMVCSFRSVGVFLLPVTSLKNALDEVSSGNLNVCLKSRINNEMGTLSNEFSTMIGGLREKERLSKLISDQAVKALEKHGDALLNDTETFEGVALVSDIRNFTGISEANDPMIITDLLNEHFAEMTKVISENGGLIYKFIGDAIEAVFPEGNEFKESASERAFKSGCMMINALAHINQKRIKRKQFTYRMGVGLCKGVMHSGTVGSFETRLDYAILGDVMKKAAKYEALSGLNPDFPLVFDEHICEKLSYSGIFSKKLESDENNTAFVLDKIGSTELEQEGSESTKSPEINASEKSSSNEDSCKKMLVFSLQNTSEESEKRSSYTLAGLFILVMVICFFIGANALYYTRLYDVRAESVKESSRLIEQLRDNSVLTSSFDELCLDFYQETRNVFAKKKESQSIKEVMEPVEKYFQNLGRPMPKYFCCYFKNNNNEDLTTEDMAFKGFSEQVASEIASIPVMMRKKDNLSELDPCIHKILGITTNSYNIRTSHFRRSHIVELKGELALVNTERIFYPVKSKDYSRDFYGYIFCAMPLDYPKGIARIKYYSILAGKNLLLAFNNGNDWVFSDNFNEKEKDFLQTNSDNEGLLTDIGYCIDSIETESKTWKVFAVSRKLAESYYSPLEFNLFVLFVSVFVIILLLLFFKNWFKKRKYSVASNLRTYLSTAAIIPILTVTFVSYLYVNEDYNVKKNEKKAELQHIMDVFESRDYYFQPFCWNYVNKVIRSEELKEFAQQANFTDNEYEKKKALESIKTYIGNNLADNSNNLFHGKKGINPHITFQEVLVVGKNNWALSVLADKGSEKANKNDVSEFGKILREMVETVYFDIYKNKNTSSINEVKSEYIVEKVIDALASTFGQKSGLKLLNFYNNPVLMSVAYSTVGAMVIPLPNSEKPDYIVIIMALFDNEKLSDFSEDRNELIHISNHIASGSVGDDVYIYASTNIDVGRRFFKNYHNENIQTLYELLRASSWVNGSNIPVSRTIDLNGAHYLEVRPGNKIGNFVLASLTSDYPVRQKVFDNVPKFAFIIIISILLIMYIAHSIVSDLISPVNILIEGAKSAENGIYSFRANYNSGDELGALCNSFDKMMKGLEEKQLMNRMVSKTALDIASDEADTSSKRVDVFLLYIVVPGFAEILHNTPPAELFANLKNQTARISEIVLSAGGDIDKIMGEKMLIAFHTHGKNAKEVALSACKIAREIETDNNLSYKVAVGVNYGQVISGYLGVGEKRDFTVIGDPVNVAARIATFAEKQEKDRRMVSETVKQFIEKKLVFERFGEVSLKGKSQPMSVYLIV